MPVRRGVAFSAGVVYVCMVRCLENGDIAVFLGRVPHGVDNDDDLLVGNRLNGVGGKQFHAVGAFSENVTIGTRENGRRHR